MVAFPIATVLENFGMAVVNYIPNVVSAIILLVIGLIVGKVVGKIVKEVLVKLKIDQYVTEGKKQVISISNIFAIIARWWIYLAFIAAALSEDILGVPTIANWMNSIVGFIPNVVGAALIIIVGYILGEFINDQIKKTGTVYGSIVGKITMFFVVYVAVAMALPILGISAALVNSILLVIIGSLGLGVAIAIGLGLKGPVETITKKYLQKSKYLK